MTLKERCISTGTLIDSESLKYFTDILKYITKEEMASILKIDIPTTEYLLRNLGKLSNEDLRRLGKAFNCDAVLIGIMVLNELEDHLSNNN
jgi:hypothetical protein